jgi:hypothetical protein
VKRVETPVATLTPSVYSGTPNDRQITFNTGDGNRVGLYISADRAGLGIAFDVNDSMTMTKNLSLAERQAIALRLMIEVRKDARTRNDGQRYYIGAFTGDGYGEQRIKAYRAIGFSEPKGDGGPYFSGYMYSVVRRGKLIPADENGNPIGG